MIRDGSYRELEEAAARWGQERAELQREVARLSAGLEAARREVDKELEVNKQLRCESIHDAERSISAGHYLFAFLLSLEVTQLTATCAAQLQQADSANATQHEQYAQTARSIEADARMREASARRLLEEARKLGQSERLRAEAAEAGLKKKGALLSFPRGVVHVA